jgi:CO/xanthine dehydrogenase Mo-binding subunit
VAFGGGLVVGCVLPTGRALAATDGRRIGAWIQVGQDGSVTIFVEEAEMGQGVFTSLPALVAEDLEVEWKDVRVAPVPLEGEPRSVATVGSSSVRKSWDPLRQAGAAAREMLLAAAAASWNVPPVECSAEGGRIWHRRTGRALPYSQLVDRAAALPVPNSPRLKSRRDFRLIGKPLPRLDIPEKVNGTAVFGIDVVRPDMLRAAVVTSPVFGGSLAACDEDAALAVSGVRAVVTIPGGVAVAADHYWQAKKGLDALAPAFQGGNQAESTVDYAALLRSELETPGLLVDQSGEAQEASPSTEQTVEAVYEVPFLAHATMEPMNCTAHVSDGACEIWAPTQGPSKLRADAAEALGIPQERIRVHTTLMGGGFGRRFESDFGIQAVLVSRATGRPVQVIWSREEDMRHGYYRGAYAAKLRATVDSDGAPVAWIHHVAGPWWDARGAPSWLRESVAQLQRCLGSGLIPDSTPDAVKYRFPSWVRDGSDGLAVGGATPLAYRTSSHRVEFTPVDTAVPVGWWRSVGSSQNGFFIESFVDELADAAERDPYEYRRDLLVDQERARNVLDRAAEASGWGQKLPARHGRGIALYYFAKTWVCEVVEASVEASGAPKVHRVTCVVDCGQVVNPDTLRAQMEGSIIFGLSAALHGGIHVEGGAVVEADFHDVRLMRLAETPAIEVHILESDAPIGGGGEPGTPPVAPALANAIFAATGVRIRRLPIDAHQDRLAASRPG